MVCKEIKCFYVSSLFKSQQTKNWFFLNVYLLLFSVYIEFSMGIRKEMSWWMKSINFFWSFFFLLVLVFVWLLLVIVFEKTVFRRYFKVFTFITTYQSIAPKYWKIIKMEMISFLCPFWWYWPGKIYIKEKKNMPKEIFQ